jgi:lipid-A-disaccharide synthase-like uncharacterized protein
LTKPSGKKDIPELIDIIFVIGNKIRIQYNIILKYPVIILKLISSILVNAINLILKNG